MNAGTLYVQVEADFQKFTSQMAELSSQFKSIGQDAADQISSGIEDSSKKIEDSLREALTEASSTAASVAAQPVTQALQQSATAAGQGGTRVASAFGDKFSAWMDKSREQLSKKFSSFISPLALVGAAENAITTGLEKGLAAGLEELVNSVPIVGSAYRIGTAIGNKIAEALTETGAMEAALEERSAEFERRLKAASAKESILREEQQGLAEARTEQREIRRRLRVAQAQKTEDPFAVLSEETIVSQERLRDEFERKRANAKSEYEKQILNRNFQLEYEILEERYETERKKLIDQENEKKAADEARIANEAAKREEEARKLAEKQAEDDLKRIEDEQQAREKMLEDLAKQAEDLDDERLAAQRAGVGEVQTALGTFRFDAYPQEMKRANDERIVKALESIKDKQSTGGFI